MRSDSEHFSCECGNEILETTSAKTAACFPRSRKSDLLIGTFYLPFRRSGTTVLFYFQLLRFMRMFSNDSGFTVQACHRYKTENRLGGMLVATRSWYV